MMQKWSRTLSKVIPSLIFALICLSIASVCFALDPSPVPGAETVVGPATGIGGWVHDQGGFVAAIVAVMLAVLALLKGLHDACIELHISEPGWLGTLAGWIATALRYLTGGTSPPLPDKTKQI